MQWEIRQGTDVSMPFEEDDVVGLLERNKLGADALVRPFGKTAWKPALKHAPFAMAVLVGFIASTRFADVVFTSA